MNGRLSKAHTLFISFCLSLAQPLTRSLANIQINGLYFWIHANRLKFESKYSTEKSRNNNNMKCENRTKLGDFR